MVIYIFNDVLNFNKTKNCHTNADGGFDYSSNFNG